MDTVSSRPFQYNAIRRQEIRLLQFNLEECKAQNISCSLRTVALYGGDSSPRRINAEYIALSYTWSPNHPSRPINLNRQTFPVGENLYQALPVLLQVVDGRHGHIIPNEGAAFYNLSCKRNLGI